MTTLTEFLEQRIAEDEAVATLVLSAPPEWTMTVWPHDGEKIPVEAARRTFDPARVLAQCAALRAVVGLHSSCDDVSYGDASTCPTLRHLASIWADHDGFDPEWRVS